MSRRHTETSTGMVRLGGMSTEWFADPSRPENLVNMTLDRDGAWRSAGGTVQALATSYGTGIVRSLAWFSQHNGGRQFLVYERETGGGLALCYSDFSGAAERTIEASSIRKPLVSGPHPGSTFIEHADWLYVLNGYSPAIRWNGSRKVPVGFSTRPPAPVVSPAGYDFADAMYAAPGFTRNKPFQRGIGADQGATENVSRWLVGYAVTWVNDLGMESQRSPIAWVQGRNSDSGTDVRGVRSIGVQFAEAPAHVFGMRLYRTVNTYGGAETDGAVLYHVADIPSGAGVHYVDDAPDYELLVEYDDNAVGQFPARAALGVITQGRMWVDDGALLRYSAPNFVEQFPSQNFYPLPGGPITGIAAYRGAVVVFKARGIWLIRAADTDPVQLSASVGCSSPRAIVDVPGGGLLFLSEDGPYMLVGALDGNDETNVVPLGPQIGQLWNERVNRKALRGARAALNLADREIWIQVATGGDDRLKLGLVYHYVVGAWSVREDYPFSALAASRDHRGLLFAGSWDLTSASTRGVFVYSRGYVATTASEVRSPWLRPGARAVPVRVELTTLNVGRALSFQHHVDREAEAWSTASERQLYQSDTERTRSKWGSTSTWGAAKWAPRVPVLLNLSVSSNSGDEFQFRVTGTKLAVFGYEAMWTAPSSPSKGLHQ